MMSRSVTLAQASEFLKVFQQRVNRFDKDVFDMLDDECEVTSTRDFLTLRWRGARFRQLIGPSIEDAKRRNSTVDYRDIQMNLEGDAVHITATAVFKQSGIERPWLATVARDDEGKLVFREFHDGVPHPTGE